MFEDEQTSHIPVIIISGRSEEEVKSRDLPENVVGIIAKPVDSSTLLEYIDTNLNRKA
jgi:FixJ family two-component response regulator